MTPIAGAVLAAGSGSRMGQAKAELVVNGIRLLDRAILAMSRAGCAPLRAVVRAGTVVDGAEAIANPDPSRGMRSSLQLAVAGTDDDAALAVLLVDTPGISADAVRAVCEAWQPGRIAVARFGSRRGHPTVMSGLLWRAALDLAAPDEGARALLSARPDLVDDIATTGDATDLDTPADLRRWEGR